MAVYSILCEIFLTTQRMFMLMKNKLLKDLTIKTVGPVAGALAFLWYAAYWFCYEWITTGRVFSYRNQSYVEWSLVLNSFSKSSSGVWLLSGINFSRMALALILLIANIFAIIAFRSYFSKKENLTTSKAGQIHV
jgi:hypothetical protein